MCLWGNKETRINLLAPYVTLQRNKLNVGDTFIHTKQFKTKLINKRTLETIHGYNFHQQIQLNDSVKDD